jgi:fumarate hydratase subunit beta
LKDIAVTEETKIPRHIQTPLTEEVVGSLRTGDMVLISGDVYTARDVAHRRMYEALLKGEKLPIDLQGTVIFYAAPTPTPPGKVIGSIGPTTSYRMDAFTPKLIEKGLKGMIGKGSRSPEVIAALQKYGAVYFGAIGGIAALSAQCVQKVELIAYEDLGPEAIRKLTIIDFPAIVVNDAFGNDLYVSAQSRWRISLI